MGARKGSHKTVLGSGVPAPLLSWVLVRGGQLSSVSASPSRTGWGVTLWGLRLVSPGPTRATPPSIAVAARGWGVLGVWLSWQGVPYAHTRLHTHTQALRSGGETGVTEPLGGFHTPLGLR